MTDAATATETTADVAGAAPTASVECMIHLRFNPDGTAAEIGERPAGVPAHEWYVFLSMNTTESYQALSGGRGIFRIPRTTLETLKAKCLAERAS